MQDHWQVYSDVQMILKDPCDFAFLNYNDDDDCIDLTHSKKAQQSITSDCNEVERFLEELIEIETGRYFTNSITLKPIHKAIILQIFIT